MANEERTQKSWDEIRAELEAMELPSPNEAKSSKYDLDPVPDGSYQVRILEFSDRLENKFNADVDRRAVTFRILREMDSDDPQYVGAKFKQFLNVSSHPKSGMYPYFKAAAGGTLDPSVRPRLIDLVDAQVIGTLLTEMNDNGEEKQVFTGIRPARKKIDDPPF